MIFSIEKHIQQIMDGNKTQTRRKSGRYEVGRLYAIQPGRGKKGIPDGKILITAKTEEYKSESPIWGHIRKWQAEAEGGYTPPDAVFALYKSRKSQQEVRIHGGKAEDMSPELKAVLSQQVRNTPKGE